MARDLLCKRCGDRKVIASGKPRCRRCRAAENRAAYDPAQAHARYKRYIARPGILEKRRQILNDWRRRYPEKVAAIRLRSYRKLKAELLDHYGRACVCCGEAGEQFLAIDHANGDGAAHRRQIGGGQNIYYWLRKNNFPPGFQTLCHNCNMARSTHGYCHGPEVGHR